MFVVCKAHIERAIDQFVDEYEEAPDIYELKNVRFSAWEPPATCEHCGEKPEVLVV